jgi:purine-nucleoside phosphorylase
MISAMSDAADPFARAEASAVTLKKLAGVPHFDAAVVLGSGWMAAADAIGTPEREIALADLSGFPPPTVARHRSAECTADRPTRPENPRPQPG